MSVWALRFILYFVCVLLTQPQNRFEFLYPFHIADISVAGAIFCHFAACGQEGRSFLKLGPGTIFGFALLGFALLSQYVGPLQQNTEWNAYIDIVWKNFIILILVEAMCTSVYRIWMVQAVIFTATMWWVKGGIRLSAAGATYAGDRVMGPAVSMIENPNGFAYMMCLMIPLYLYFYQQAKNKFNRYLFLAIAIAAVFIVLRTGSRTGFLALIAVGVFLIPKYGAKHKMGLIIGGVAIFFLSSSIGALNIERFKTINQSIAAFFSKEKKVEKPADQMTIDEQSAWERKMKNVHTFTLIKRYPIFGVGMNPADPLIPDDVYLARGQVHCEILMAGRQMGFIGMGLYAAHIAMIFIFGLKVERYCKGWWPAVSDLGWTFKMQAVVFIVGGAFSPLPWNVMALIYLACASALWGLVKQTPRPAHLIAAR